MGSVTENLGTGVTVLIAVLTAAVLVLGFSVYLLNRKFSEINRAYKRTFRKGRGLHLEELIEQNLEIMENASEVSRQAMEKMQQVESDMAKCIQNVGMVKYKAFRDMGGDLSFSLALLDANKDGVIITNLFGESGCSAYSKPVTNGKSDFLLSLEEKEALEIAVSEKEMKIPGREKKPTIPKLIASVVANNILAARD